MILIKTLIFIIIATGSATIVVPYLLLSASEGRLSYDLGLFRLFGGFFIALGVAIYLWCAWKFFSAGKGTPAFWDPPVQFVSAGPYRLVRNPMYLGIELVVFGEAIAFGSGFLLAYAIILGVAFHAFVLFYEEPHLKAKFGETYMAYCKAVPRWLPTTFNRHYKDILKT